MLIADQRLWLERDPVDLPSAEVMTAEVIEMRDSLIEISEAPVLDADYIGPVIFEEEAAADLFRFMLRSMNRKRSAAASSSKITGPM